MSLILLLSLSFLDKEMALTPYFEIDEDTQFEGAFLLNQPFDVQLINNNLYIATAQGNILVFEDYNYSFTIGQKGSGPSEFKHPPVQLEFRDNQLIATEMYGWKNLYFSLNGSFIKKESVDRSKIQIGSRQFNKVPLSNLNSPPFRLEYQGTFLGKLSSRDDIGFHLSNFISLESFSKEIFFIRKQGIIEQYSPQLALENIYQLKVGDLKREPMFDKMLTQLNKRFKKSDRKFYLFSEPIFDAAINENAPTSNIWFLASNEWKIQPRRRRGEVWLLKLNLTNRSVKRIKIDSTIDKIRIFDQSLALISPSGNFVRLYKLSMLDKLMK